MGRPYDHQYLDTRGASCGTMICGGCNSPIREGQFRAYKRTKNYDWGFVTHHRACCSEDPAWAKQDVAAAAHEQHCSDLRAAAIAFRDRWIITDLDELIRDLASGEGE